jgi:hypothetical protein
MQFYQTFLEGDRWKDFPGNILALDRIKMPPRVVFGLSVQGFERPYIFRIFSIYSFNIPIFGYLEDSVSTFFSGCVAGFEQGIVPIKL